MWPEFKRARDLAFKELPLSEEQIKQLAIKHGIGRMYGRTLIFSPDDLKQLHEAQPCPSHSCVANGRPTGSSAARSADSELRKALELAGPKKISRPRKKPRPNSKT